MKKPRQIRNEPPTRGAKKQPLSGNRTVGAVGPLAATAIVEAAIPGETTEVKARWIALITSDPANASLLPVRAIEPTGPEPDEVDRILEERRQDWKALDQGIIVCIPGLLAAQVFDLSRVLFFLVGVVVNHQNRIEAVLQLIVKKGPSFRTKQFKKWRDTDRIRVSLEWRQIVFLANAIHTHRMVQDVSNNFGSPFATGLASIRSFSRNELIAAFCQFFHAYSEVLSNEIILKGSVRETAVDLAEALVIAETVNHYLGFQTELDDVGGGFIEPTALEIQAWEITANSLDFNRRLASETYLKTPERQRRTVRPVCARRHLSG